MSTVPMVFPLITPFVTPKIISSSLGHDALLRYHLFSMRAYDCQRSRYPRQRYVKLFPTGVEHLNPSNRAWMLALAL
ncbi:hypothetical protein [Brevibacillus fluminis]|uniref:hypothetical protein n=1 Tax=Brevibacillus fluminis TaxID=511487 RepID=UPI0011CDE0EF|nr:hypothetical protein [Brevibacillus fluminis]